MHGEAIAFAVGSKLKKLIAKLDNIQIQNGEAP